MKFFFPPKNQKFLWLQTNRSDDLGSLWSTFNNDFQTNLGTLRLAQKLVQNTSSADDSDLGVPAAFEFWSQKWYAICDTTIFQNSGPDITLPFTEDAGGVNVGSSTTQFDVTNPAGTTFRYTWDGNGTDPAISVASFPVGSIVTITGTNLAAGNRGTFTVTGSGANYFEVTNAAGVVESDKTINTGSVRIAGGSLTHIYSYQQSDLAVFDDRLWTTSGGLNPHLYSRTANLYTVRDDLGASALHKLLYFKQFDRLYYMNEADTICSIDAANAVADPGADYAIDLTVSIGQMTTMVATTNYIWIATVRTQNTSSENGTSGSIMQWDGFSAQVTAEYILPSAGALAMVVLNDVPYALDSEGRLLKYTGYSFEEIGRLPVDRILLIGASTTSSGQTNGRFVHFNGMAATKNNTIQVLIKNLNEDSQSNVSENLPSGVWEYDLATGNFTHRYSPTLKTLASSTVSDYGQNIISRAGALKINPFASNTTTGRSTFLAGFRIFTDASATKSAIFIDSPASSTADTEGQKRGYFVTTWFNSEEIQDKWTRLWVVFKRFLDSTDKMVFKYRLNEEDAVLADITWVDTTHFTTATNPAAYGPTVAPFNGTVGGEVEVLQGPGSGSCTHITNITGPNGGLYTVTLENPVPNVGTATAKVRFQKWVKMHPEITGQVLSYAQLPIGQSNTQCMIKCVMEFTGADEFRKMAIFTNEDIKIGP